MIGDEADRLHRGLIDSFVASTPLVPGARFEPRDGYVLGISPGVPFPGFNGLGLDRAFAQDELAQAIAEVEAAGVPCWIITRVGTVGPFEATAAALGFHLEETVPGMALRDGELVPGPPSPTEIRRVDGGAGLDAVLDIAADAFEAPPAAFATMYAGIVPVDGFSVYWASVDGVPVSTATSWRSDRSVGIYNVATPAEHRRHGFARAVTECAIRDGLAAGADLAWLQSSTLGEPVYRAMGFRRVERYEVWARGEETAGQ